MKKTLLLILPLLFILGCSTEGEIKFINRTQHNLYFSVNGGDYALEGATPQQIADGEGTSQKVSVNTGREFLFWGADTKNVQIYLEGETFLIFDGNGWITETTVKVEPKETTRIFADPTHAGVKLINQSGMMVSRLYYFTDYDSTLRLLVEDIADGGTFFAQLPFSTNEQEFYYTFRVKFENNTEIDFGGPGDENANLGLDDQFLINLN
ncbi:MAG: hypothetical protein JXB60_04525 [Candidatus Cloacimonetes bacterium]|nr:hypothetical protein [Candidatus Cloacimonadota bacterium]